MMYPHRSIKTTLAITLLLLVFLKSCCAVRQNPLKNPKICGRPQCNLSTHKFALEEKIYAYDYETEVRSEFSGTGQNVSELFLNAKIELVFAKPCEGFLRITEVRLRDQEDIASDTKSGDDQSSEINEKFSDDYYGEFAAGKDSDEIDLTKYHPKTIQLDAALKKHMLRFAFYDGLINEVCSANDEPTWVLNIKKGILSAFQNTMMRFDIDSNMQETDVSGTCNVQYTLQKTDSKYVIISKSKDIPTCQNRYATQSVLQTTPYTFRDDKIVWPVLNSESYCNMTVDRSIYREISCFERHQLVPFSNGTTGAVTTSRSKFKINDNDVQTYNRREFLEKYDTIIEKRTTLLFDHAPSPKPTHGELNIAEDLIKRMCIVGFPTIQRDFVDIYTNFLQVVKNLDYEALQKLLDKSEHICATGKSHMLESLPYIGSAASYRVMRDEIIGNTVHESLAKDWMTSLAFIQRPDEQIVDTFYAIFEFGRKKADPEYTLGAAAVIHSYCRYHDSCNENEKVSRIVRLLENDFLSLFNLKRLERRVRERMLIILKALGNIGVLSEKFSEQLQGIIAVEASAPIEIRLEAILAFRRVDCMKYRHFFLETFGNFHLNAEVRIYSFLQSMRCPDYITVKYLKSILNQEEVNQVGSFVWSFLKNLATSSSPLKIEIQGLLLNLDLEDKFKKDMRKFSRNYEHSVFFDEYNFGTTTDMNLIFGTDSYLPRIATLNFTTHLFGQSVNFFEFSARAEGFEKLIASIFGPQGSFGSQHFYKKLGFLNRWLGNESSEDEDTFENLLSFDALRAKREAGLEDNLDEMETDEIDEIQNNQRTKRTTSEEVEAHKNQIQKNVNNFNYKLKYDYDKPSAQFGLRIFGNDLRYYSLEGILEVMALTKEFDPFYQISKILYGNNVIYTKTRVFLDAAYTVPLSNGLPLSIHAFGASSIDLRLSGNLQRMQESEWHFDVEAKFKPSISVDVITTMQSDMYYATSGIKVKSNLYSNMEAEAKMKVRGEKQVQFAFSLPQDRSEIFSANSELLVMTKSELVPQNGISKRSSNSTCTWPALDEAIGLKICSHYSVPDVSNAKDVIYPSLILSGPLNFSLILTKSDLTAKNFSFEYKWDRNVNESKWSLVFHTPSSAVKRQLIANVTTTQNHLNASLSFKHGKSSILAGCNYDGDPNERRLDVFLFTNGNRSLDLSMELLRWQERSLTVYKPKVLLTINNVNVTGLVGVIKRYDKNDIIQNDFELSFETRKLQALLRGNFIQSEVTTSTNISANYRFQANKVETVNIQGKLVNHGDKAKTEYRGNVQLHTSAYPKLNFHTNATWLSMQGHTEGVLSYNNGATLRNPAYASNIRLVLVHSDAEGSIWDGPKTWGSLELRLPKSNIDFGISVKHERRFKNGTEHNVLVDLRYATGKEASGVFSVYFPQRSLFAIDAYMNITIPDFNSTSARLKITERISKNYMINFNGSWFTGHSIVIKGNYKDRSSRVQSIHHLKLVVESPSFKVTSLNVIYRRNQFLIYADVQAKYDKDPYGILIQYDRNVAEKSTSTKVQFKILDKLYSLTGQLMTDQPKLLLIEIHLDRLRDIHIKLGSVTLERRKVVSLEFQWDANRDPSQRLGLSLEYNNPKDCQFEGNMMLTYPDRTISCGFETSTAGPTYYGNARVSWNVNEVIVLSYDAGLLPDKVIHNWIHAEILTPFEGWQKNRLSAGVFSADNLILANSSLLWANNQSFEVGYKSDYYFGDPITSFEVRFGINSTLKDVPTLGVLVKHWQNLCRYDSELDLRYSGINETLNEYMIKSSWDLSHVQNFQNISGTMLMVTPFEKYRKGGLVAKFSLSEENYVSGAAALNFDLREFTFAMNGYVKKFTDNMLTVNITTPLEKFRTINGRLGVNEHKRHIVAEVRAPHAIIGAEALFDILSITNFDIKLSMATPIENFTRVALFAKLRSETVDLRGLWGKAQLGFTGVWYMNNITDFEYSYRVFTPLPHFEDNGFIAKFQHQDAFIFNLYAKFSIYELGVRINGQKRSTLLNQLAANKIELEFVNDNDFAPAIKSVNDEDYDLSEIDYDEFLSLYVDFELHTLVWPKIDGFVDIQEMLDYYLAFGNIQLPQGLVEIKNRLYFPDYVNVLNVMNVNTPFNASKQVKIILEYHVDLDSDKLFDKLYMSTTDAAGNIKELGIALDYTKVQEALKPKEYNVQINLQTPFDILKQMSVSAIIEADENLYRANVSAQTKDTLLSVAAAVESEDNFLETSAVMMLQTDIVPYYALHAHLRKDLSATKNNIQMQIHVTDNNVSNKIEFDTNWQNERKGAYHVQSKLETTFLPIKRAELTAVLVQSNDPLLDCNLIIVANDKATGDVQKLNYGVQAKKQKEVFNVELWSPLKNYRNISMHGSIIEKNAKTFNIKGKLYHNMKTHQLDGVIYTDKGLNVLLQVDSANKINIDIANDPAQAKGQKISILAIGGVDKFFQAMASYSIKDATGLECALSINSTEVENLELKAQVQLKSNAANGLGFIGLEVPQGQLFGLSSVKIRPSTSMNLTYGRLEYDYHLQEVIGRGTYAWTLIPSENIQVLLENSLSGAIINSRNSHVSFAYLNPKKNFQRAFAGTKIHVDNLWQLAVNSTLNYHSTDDAQLSIITKLPHDPNDVHTINARYRGNLISQQGKQPDVFVEAKYLSEVEKRKFLTRVTFRNLSDTQGSGRIEWGTLLNLSQIEGSFQMLRKAAVRREFFAKLVTPMYENDDTIFVNGNYDVTTDYYHLFKCALQYPGSNRVAETDMSFKTLSDMHGFANTSLPFANLTWLRADIDFRPNYRYVRGAWPADFAYVKLENVHDIDENQPEIVKGNVEIEVPFANRHEVNLTYYLKQSYDLDIGNIDILYNKKQVLKGNYTHELKKMNALYVDVTHIMLENDLKPLGLHYVSTQDSSNKLAYPSIKHIEIFELNNNKNFNLTGELHMRNSLNGQELKFLAIHPNRTVILTTDYETIEHVSFRQRSKLQLSPTAWIGYNINLLNMSKTLNESQNFNVELFYPSRNLSTYGWYYHTSEEFNSKMSLRWNLDAEHQVQKELRMGVLWEPEKLKDGDLSHQHLFFTIEHPYLEKDVEIKGTYYRGIDDLFKAQLKVNYSYDPSQLVEVNTKISSLSKQLGQAIYAFQFDAQHPASELSCRFNGSSIAKPLFYKLYSEAIYKREYFADKYSKFIALLDLNKKEIEYLSQSPYRSVRFWGIPISNYPKYGFNATIWDSEDTNNTGYVYIDVYNRMARMDFNLTEDASQNLQMYGNIPDSRSGFLDIWRNYDEIRISDVAAYLKMNHSRLITGRFHWRPQIRNEIKEKIQAIGVSLNNSFSDGVDFWIKSLYSESVDAMALVWTTTKVYNQRFIDDISELSVLEQDLETLRQFVNQSYESNDFYIKTVVNFTLTVLDELAIRDHIASLPVIFSEMWHAMGDTGKALRQSILSLIETIKLGYNNVLEAISRFFHGESLHYLSSLIEKGVEKYDKFVKDLHIRFIKYVEHLNYKVWRMLEAYWKYILKRIEPHVFKFLSMIESAAWDLSKEVFDFIYKRTNELAESPYFNKVSSFTQDVDRLYRDIKSHDAVTNIRKYTAIAWSFIKEKYMKLVPFGHELNEVLTELWDEIKQLQKVDQVAFIVQKYQQIVSKLEWIGEELQLERRMQQLYTLIMNKLSYYTMNALETADMYREAKTKFIFDPEVGIVDLEQKLPMSWHAFNETPKFEEIPEYRFLLQAQNVFSNTSFLHHIYNWRTNLDPKTWLPPYPSHALIIDSQHFMTFDERHVQLDLSQCSYMLAHDFFEGNFTLFLEQTSHGKNAKKPNKKLTFVADAQLFEIDLERDRLSVNGRTESMLPLAIQNVQVHREMDILTIQSTHGYSLVCNLQFHLCNYQVSGWYFGRTAGLLGTMNNEHYDDFLTPQQSIAANSHAFTTAWSNKNCRAALAAPQVKIPSSISDVCAQFFKSGMFSACTSTINATPFHEMCLDLAVNASPIKQGHPAIRGACTAALAYIEACKAMKIPMRVPSQCVFCQLHNGSYVPEGTFIELQENDVPHSSDIVFIVEAKPCNGNLTLNKSLMAIVSAIEQELKTQNIINNRFAVVTFGGQAPFDEAHTIVHENQVFTEEYQRLQQYFNHIKVQNGSNNDVLQAISHTSRLPFRAGVSKNLILLLCNQCEATQMRFDYGSILQYMHDEGVNLHILADTEFEFERTRKLRHFFGLDRHFVYTKRALEGDAELREQIHISKSTLGICLPLALETDGSVFSARKLMPERKYPIKRLAGIFAKRVAKTAKPTINQSCECSAYNSGVSYMACAPQDYMEDETDIENYDAQFNLADWENENDFEA